jgi:adenine-specific DNA-methyltransferase
MSKNIDPPYNTGNDFIYPDKYSETLETYLAYAGLLDGEGRKFATNTPNEGRFHTKWLNMMYPRLYLAKNLLSNDGVIFISIDDNEIINLIKLCDEIFGEENFVGIIIVQTNKGGQDYKEIAKTHEYLICYTKNEDTTLNEIEKDNVTMRYKDSIGRFNIRELRNRNPKFGKFNRPNLYYPIYVNSKSENEDGFCSVSLVKSEEYNIEVFPLNSEGKESCWRWSKELFCKKNSPNINESDVVAKQKRDGGWNVYEKYRKSTQKAKTIWDETEIRNEKGTIELRELGMKGLYDHPKPTFLVKKASLIGLNSDEGDIILDFFAGSCTTAHAILDLNKEDGGNRKFIMVQLPEPCDEESEAYKAGYKTIADIGKERIRRVIKKIEEEQAAKANDPQMQLPGLEEERPQLDLGFKVFKLDRSNFRVWDGTDPEMPIEKLVEQLTLHADHINAEASQEDILYELLLKAGYPLTSIVEKMEMAGKTVYSIAEGALLICLEDEITRELIDAAAEAEPVQFICLDRGFKGNDQLKANAMQTFAARNQGRDKEKQIVFRTV